jgi:hypothetical protein
MAPIVLLRGSEVCLCIAEQRMNKVRMSASEGITDIARAGRNRSKVTLSGSRVHLFDDLVGDQE